ncbi:N-acetylmuramoyl-L-alanine amidase [Streptomyces sp. SID4928]|uniref:peptidoglycan-binding protein n=1 Tax=Streptomyces TaxID=1883 RepID=UPI0001C1CF0C|nr:peptidoglycan-binding protein [Streptomyces sp. ACT-1]EGE40762.1 N-acetylmuramoyl-L-alanine amidase family 2 [Streptomyces sp. ACT-1]MYR48836.1 N-acetylmuramoyl-L-alanine amidase [Streptomyces sp. SID4928]
MATPLTADRLLKALRDEGLTVIEHRSWRTNNRNHKGPIGPMHGVMIHHTVTSGTASSVELCYNGHSALPGPLCHGVIDKAGTVHLVGNGRTNHAGLGDDDVLRAVAAESKTLPADNEANTDGNRHFYGFECVNLGDGKDPWPAAQLLAIERAAAAICRAHGWSQRSVIGHLEWQPGKIDPRGFTMASMRDRIGKRLAPDPAPTKPPATKPPTPAKPKCEPYPGASFFLNGNRPALGKKSPIFTAMGKRLVAVGCGRYAVGPGPQLGQADVNSYEAWQRKCGYTGTAAKWPPGKTTWDKLQVPKP